MVIGNVFPVGYGFPKPVPLKFAVAGLAVILTGNPLELMEDEFRTFVALINVARRIIKAIDAMLHDSLRVLVYANSKQLASR
jgi:hypothetical protein